MELQRPRLHPEAGTVHCLPDQRQRRQEEQADRRDAEDVLVRLEAAEIVAQQNQRRGEGGDADDDPEPLPERVVRVEAVDLGHAEGSEQAGQGQQVRVGLRHRDPRDYVCRDVEPEEEQCVRQRGRGDDLLARDVHAGEAEARDDPDDEEVEELAVSEGHRYSAQ